VLGAFLVLPALFALQSVVSDRFVKSFRNTISLGILALGILLAFWASDLLLHMVTIGPNPVNA